MLSSRFVGGAADCHLALAVGLRAGRSIDRSIDRAQARLERLLDRPRGTPAGIDSRETCERRENPHPRRSRRTLICPLCFQDPRGTATRTGQPPSRITSVSDIFRFVRACGGPSAAPACASSFRDEAFSRMSRVETSDYAPTGAVESAQPSLYRTYLSGEVGAARVAKRLGLNDYSRSRGEVNRS